MKKFLRVLVVIAFVVFIALMICFLYITDGLDSESQPELIGFDVTQTADGTYDGLYKKGRFTNEVSVTVAGGKVTDIRILEDVTFAKKETSDLLFTRVIEAQSTDVDVVSGATVTSNAYLKAIENALNGQS